MPSEALDSVLKALEMDSKNGQLAMLAGRMAMEIDNVDIALRVFARVAMMKPVDQDPTGESITLSDRADANYCLAYLSYRQGDARKAKIMAMKALADNPEHAQAQQLVAQVG
jgi:tetratricopeptide (TPR) repeat protein